MRLAIASKEDDALSDDESTDELIANLLRPVYCGMCRRAMPSRWPPICDGCMERIGIIGRAIQRAREANQ
jgi:hypothetical protein